MGSAQHNELGGHPHDAQDTRNVRKEARMQFKNTLARLACLLVAAPFAGAISLKQMNLADLSGRARIPSVVAELLLGILIGPHVLGWATIDDVSQTLAQFGLAMLIFLAGFEVDIPRVRGRPLNLAVGGWLLSLVLGITVLRQMDVEVLVVLFGLYSSTTTIMYGD